MDLISKTLHYLGKKEPNSIAVQIGAMDGISFDDTRGFFDMYKWKTVLVEPIPEYFQELQNNLKDRTNLLYENSAIGKENGVTKMLTIPRDSITKNELPEGYAGMSATYPLKNGFGSTYQRDIDVKNKYGVDIKVPVITFDTLVEKHSLSDVNILICDAEGRDWEILKTIDLDKYNIKFIRAEWINLTPEEQKEALDYFEKHNYVTDVGMNIDAVKREIYDELDQKQNISESVSNFTIVSGLWNLNREGRGFDSHYLPRFREFLQIPHPMILFLPEYLHEEVWKVRTPNNTTVIKYELEDIKKIYEPHWEKTQEIRTSEAWINITGENGWLKTSPQATLEYYNPIVQSKMFLLHESIISNPFNTDYFYWIDAGLTNTVPSTHLIENNALETLSLYSNPFLFLSYPYQATDEIHGMDYKKMVEIVGQEVEYVCRGGLFGGHKEQIREANAEYYSLLSSTLSQGIMGTEESLFCMMSYLKPEVYQRFELDGNGLIVKFTGALLEGNVELTQPLRPVTKQIRKITDKDVEKLKTNVYILTFNFPEQILHTINSMKQTPEWLERPSVILLDNSTDNSAIEKNKEIAQEHNFEYISLEGNTGICGGRQYAAEHFHDSEADYMFFFEDDMTSNPPSEEGKFCRNGLRKYIPNLYNIVHKIMLKEDFDFLKLSFTEVYWDNNIQTSWYNVPQEIRTRDWPEYDKLPQTGSDPNAPRTKFEQINNLDGVAYITGEVTYTNWPMIVSKKGNEKMFIETKWAHPYEQTWMSHMYQLKKEGKLNPAVLLASPIWHDRIKYYEPEERREN